MQDIVRNFVVTKKRKGYSSIEKPKTKKHDMDYMGQVLDMNSCLVTSPLEDRHVQRREAVFETSELERILVKESLRDLIVMKHIQSHEI